MNAGFEKVSKATPCEICGKPDWCFRLEGGRVHACRRESWNGIHKIDRAGTDYWLYFEEEEKKYGNKASSK
jgi:hypothetical protein